jgi:hypothetical protein
VGGARANKLIFLKGMIIIFFNKEQGKGYSENTLKIIKL